MWGHIKPITIPLWVLEAMELPPSIDDMANMGFEYYPDEEKWVKQPPHHGDVMSFMEGLPDKL